MNVALSITIGLVVYVIGAIIAAIVAETLDIEDIPPYAICWPVTLPVTVIMVIGVGIVLLTEEFRHKQAARLSAWLESL